MINPRDFFRFGFDNFSLLKDIHTRKSVNDAELRQLIRRHRTVVSPAVDYVVGQLTSLGYLEVAPYATASRELVPAVRKFLDFLLRQQQLTPIAVIRSYLEALEQMGRDLDGAIDRKESDNALRILSECNEIIERMRHDSADNLEAIIRQTLAIKSNLEKKSVRERYMIINRIRERYLVPLREIIDIKKPIQHSLDQIHLLFREGERVFLARGPLAEEFSRSSARLLRLKKSVRSDFIESGREVEPLYKTLKRESRIIKGASQALEMIDREGVKTLNLDFPISFMRIEGMVSDDKLEGYFHELADYTPAPPGMIEDPVLENIPVEFIDPDQLREKITKALPIEDCFNWLLETYVEESLETILQAYAHVLDSKLGAVSFKDQPRRYTIRNYTIKAYPLAVEKG
jgi:hypothetical protein